MNELILDFSAIQTKDVFHFIIYKSHFFLIKHYLKLYTALNIIENITSLINR